ncbi:hypothetical protein Hanom_Chr15g01339491 [Helianthus anomalus]
MITRWKLPAAMRPRAYKLRRNSCLHIIFSITRFIIFLLLHKNSSKDKRPFYINTQKT